MSAQAISSFPRESHALRRPPSDITHTHARTHARTHKGHRVSLLDPTKDVITVVSDTVTQGMSEGTSRMPNGTTPLSCSEYGGVPHTTARGTPRAPGFPNNNAARQTDGKRGSSWRVPVRILKAWCATFVNTTSLRFTAFRQQPSVMYCLAAALGGSCCC
jgi:hypothetical protein